MRMTQHHGSAPAGNVFLSGHSPKMHGGVRPHHVPYASGTHPHVARMGRPGGNALGQSAGGVSTGAVVYGALTTASMAASAFHGYRRNQSVGWAVWWGAMGTLFPVITPAIAVAQGFGKRG